ncbi:hypothetical protein V8C35DRAFT_139830 [Trichoderma chlorosporum]
MTSTSAAPRADHLCNFQLYSVAPTEPSNSTFPASSTLKLLDASHARCMQSLLRSPFPPPPLTCFQGSQALLSANSNPCCTIYRQPQSPSLEATTNALLTVLPCPAPAYRRDWPTAWPAEAVSYFNRVHLPAIRPFEQSAPFSLGGECCIACPAAMLAVPVQYSMRSLLHASVVHGCHPFAICRNQSAVSKSQISETTCPKTSPSPPKKIMIHILQ